MPFRLPFKLLACVIMALLCAAPSYASDSERVWCVIDEVVPILDVPGGLYEIEEWDVLGDDVTGIIVYGNHVKCAPLTGEYGDSWLELLDPENVGQRLGFIPLSGLEPMPETHAPYSPAEFISRYDAPVLLLMPGASGEKYRLSEYGFGIIKGEVVTGYGETQAGGKSWTLLGFSTSIEDTGDSGIGMRYAWIETADLMPLEKYEPDHSRVDPAWLPSLMRTYLSGEAQSSAGRIKQLPDEARRRIADHGFRIEQSPPPFDINSMYSFVDDMADLYRSTGDYSVDFITTDMFLHAFHLIFVGLLEHVETKYLARALHEGMRAALAQLEWLEPELGDLGGSFDTARRMFAIPLALAGGEPSALDGEPEAEETRRIMSAEEQMESLITGGMLDYTQFKPRAQYTKSPEREAYFRAMTWLGEAGLPLFDDYGNAITDNVRTMALMTFALDATGLWEKFAAPIDLLVGKADKGTFGEYLALVKRDIGSVNELADPEKLALLADSIKEEIIPPKIRNTMTGIITREQEETARLPEFRLSGKRFTFDSYVMNQLTSPRVGSNDNPRNLPRGTDVMSVLGSEAADKYAKSNVIRYYENLARLKEEWSELLDGPEESGDGADTVYSLWLKSISANMADSGSQQFFYRSGAWGYKKLLTSSASWAELKHDTILYGEQSGAEMGAGGWYAGKFAPPFPRGYIEPDPQTFSAINHMASRLLDFILRFGYGDESDYYDYPRKLSTFLDLCATAEDIARKEAKGERIELEDYNYIKRMAREWNATLLMPDGMEILNLDDPLANTMAIIADVATDFVAGRALYAATGAPRELFVYVNDKSGGSRIAKGYVYSYYEFARSLTEGRMDDAEWKKLVYDSDEDLSPFHPEWYSEIFPGWE